jgi:glycosyltransferase involved in cell wall biosynthesis
MGGPAHQVALLSGRRFLPDRYETLLVHGRTAVGEASLAHRAEQEGARMIRVPELGRSVRPDADLMALAKLVRLIRRFRPDIVHTHTAKAGFLGRQAALLAGSPPPALVHTYHGHVLEGYFGSQRSALYRLLERRLARRTDALIGVSQATVDDLVRLGVAPAAKFHRIPLGLDLSGFTAIDAEDRVRGRRRFGLGADEIACSFVGRLVPIKRIDLLLAAFAEAREGEPRLRLLIVGDGEQRPELELLAARLDLAGSIRFLGYRDDLVPLWAASDLALLSSANEGTPVSLIEAAAAGIPAVASEVGGVREALAPGAAAIVPFGDTGAMASAIRAYAGDRERRAAAGAAARADSDRFDVARLIADIDRLYGALLSGGDGRAAA